MARSMMTITGLEELDAAMRELPKKIARQGIRKPLRAGAKVVLAEAKRNAPRGVTGNLRRSLKVRAGKRKKGIISMRVTTSEGWFKGDEFYAGFVEFGTKERRHRSGRSVGAVTARKFVRKAYLATKDRVSTQLKSDIFRNINTAIRELAR